MEILSIEGYFYSKFILFTINFIYFYRLAIK